MFSSLQSVPLLAKLYLSIPSSGRDVGWASIQSIPHCSFPIVWFLSLGCLKPAFYSQPPLQYDGLAGNATPGNLDIVQSWQVQSRVEVLRSPDSPLFCCRLRSRLSSRTVREEVIRRKQPSIHRHSYLSQSSACSESTSLSPHLRHFPFPSPPAHHCSDPHARSHFHACSPPALPALPSLHLHHHPATSTALTHDPAQKLVCV